MPAKLLRPGGSAVLAIPLVRLRPHAQFSQQIPRAPNHPRRLLQVGFKLRSLASGEIEEAAYPLDQPVVQVVILHDGRMRSGQIRLRPIQTDAPWNSGIPAQPAPRSTLRSLRLVPARRYTLGIARYLFAHNASLCGRPPPERRGSLLAIDRLRSNFATSCRFAARLRRAERRSAPGSDRRARCVCPRPD